MSQNSQLHLTNDSFLYACQSEFAARTKKDGSFKSHIRFDPFLVGEYQRPNSATWQNFVQLTTDIVRHHVSITPQFRRNEPLNLETVSYFSCSIATLFADLETACREMFGLGLPVIPAEPPEYSPEAPVSKSLLEARNAFLHQLNASQDFVEEFVPFPDGGGGADRPVQWSCEVWDTLADLIHSFYRDYADLAMGFAYWKYQETEQKQEIDWRIRPPVGEAFAKAFRPLQRASRNDRGASGTGRGERGASRGERGAGRGERDDRNKRPMKDARPDQGQSGARSHRSDEKAPISSDGHGPKHRAPKDASPRPQRGRGTGPEKRDAGPTSEKQLENALQEVYKAIESLKSGHATGEVALAPNNSFIRRQQHSLAVDLGYDTESRGEGRERGVVIRKPAPLH